MGCRVLIDPAYDWSEERRHGLVVRSKGRATSVAAVTARLDAGRRPDLDDLASLLALLPGHFAAIVSGRDWTLALADKVTGYPLFYTENGGGAAVSNSARLLARECGLDRRDDEALREFRMAGYVTGRDTLVSGLRKIQAGEVLLWAGGGLERRRYFEFYSPQVREASEDVLLLELKEHTNAIFDRLIKDNPGRRILVPLSGGLDSRIVLCKLKERGAQDLATFSYGQPGNWEALAARDIAARLDVPWRFVPTTWGQARQGYHSELRREYWRFADHLHIVPNLHTFHALADMREAGLLDGDPVLVNGQSGDFICGAHIPAIPAGEADRAALVAALAAKHYGHDLEQRGKSDWLDFVSRRVERVLGGPPEVHGAQDLAKALELWEWQARQSVRVVHGQRNYDFFGLDWELPLWEVEYLHFFRNLPLEHKLGRRLFRHWLERHDPYGLFRSYEPHASRWPRGRGWIQVVGRGMTAALGRSVSRRWYDFMDCFSQYGYLYAPYGRLGYWRGRRECASSIGAMARAWERENAGFFKEWA